MALDNRINSLRETEWFKNWAPEEKTYTLCLWIKDVTGHYYSPGKMIIDDTYLISNGGKKMITEFRQSFNKEGMKIFQYTYQDSDEEGFGDFLMLLRQTILLEGYRVYQNTPLDPDVLNIIDNRKGL